MFIGTSMLFTIQSDATPLHDILRVGEVNTHSIVLWTHFSESPLLSY